MNVNNQQFQLIQKELDSLSSYPEESHTLAKVSAYVQKMFLQIQKGEGTLKSIAQTLQIIQIIMKCLDQQKYVSKREIYYQNIHMFDSQDQVNQIVTKLAYNLQVPRRFIRIVSASKGLVSGPLVLFNSQKQINLMDICIQGKGYPISEFMDQYQPIVKAERILVIEKETIYFHFLQEQHHQFLGSTLLLTGKGYPCQSTKSFLKFVSINNPEIPVFYLGDMDPHGFDILCNYAFGSEISKYEYNQVPWIQWLNVYLEHPVKGFQQLNQKELSLLEQLLKRDELPIEWKQAMMIQQKWELEAYHLTSEQLLMILSQF